jgi:hypothetical protein
MKKFKNVQIKKYANLKKYQKNSNTKNVQNKNCSNLKNVQILKKFKSKNVQT